MMKERKFVRGTKGARMSGTKTAFRNFRKALTDPDSLALPNSYGTVYMWWKRYDMTAINNP